MTGSGPSRRDPSLPAWLADRGWRRWPGGRGWEPVAAALFALIAGLLVGWLALDVLPYHSLNDDEGVYLLQAAMLLEGKFALHPGALGEAVRPWFFVEASTPAGPRMYPKYAPVPAAMYAVGMALGAPRLTLVAVAAGVAALTYVLTAAAFDRPTGVVAAGLLVATPLFLVPTATFLPYAPTALLNLGFAAAYVRSVRRDSRRWALVAGALAGLAFFARPFTAVVFASPFVCHAILALGGAWRRDRSGSGAGDGSRRLRTLLPRYLAVAAAGLVGVGVALAYNAVQTGDPLVFPYQAFAPRDGIGFGVHEILGYERDYTPALAVETTGRVLSRLVREWTVAGPVGAALAALGAVGFLGRHRGTLRRPLRALVPADARLSGGPTASDGGPTAGDDARNDRDDRNGRDERNGHERNGGERLPGPEVAALVLAVFPAVVVGNTYFWGQLNGLENGLFGLLGPFYHYDALLPLSAFAALTLVAGGRALARGLRGALAPTPARVALALVVLVAAVVGGGVAVEAVRDQTVDNRVRTEVLAETYEPIETTDFDRALVFTPDPYGDWQAHPFQYLRNDPGFDGPVVYATDGPPERDLRVLAATNRTPYRFTYRGEWVGAASPVAPALKRLRVLRGERIDATTTVGVPPDAVSASVRVEVGGDDAYARYAVEDVRNRTDLPVRWTLGPDRARVTNFPLGGGADGVALPAAGEVDLAVTFVDAAGASVTYRQEVTLASGESARGTVRAIWPPETRVCRLTTECGSGGTWIGPDGEYVAGIAVETDARVANATAGD